MPSSATILELAQQIAISTPDFFVKKGPSIGDKATLLFMAQLRQQVREVLGYDCSEQKLVGDAGFAADFYVRSEASVIEIALSLHNPMSEFEKDILKALMAKELGNPVERLVFISKPGALKRHSSPGSRAIRGWVERNHGIVVEIDELTPPSD